MPLSANELTAIRLYHLRLQQMRAEQMQLELAEAYAALNQAGTIRGERVLATRMPLREGSPLWEVDR